MNGLKKKIFWVILSILTIFLLSILCIFNFQSYYQEKNQIENNLNRMANVREKNRLNDNGKNPIIKEENDEIPDIKNEIQKDDSNIEKSISNNLQEDNDSDKVQNAHSTHRVNLIIEDNGIGIPKSDLNRVFDKGFTGENGRKYGKSTGIGLYLCKKLCEKMQIGIYLESELGIGTKVIIKFP